MKMTRSAGLHGEEILIFTKKRGYISVREIDEFLLRNVNPEQYNGVYYVPFVVKEESDQGWEIGESKLLDADSNEVSDKVVLTRANDGEPCCFCGLVMPGTYCPHCGETIRQEDYSNL